MSGCRARESSNTMTRISRNRPTCYPLTGNSLSHSLFICYIHLIYIKRASKLLSKIKTSSRKSRTNSDKGDDKSSQDSSMEGGNGSTTASTKKKSKLDSSTEEDYVRRSEVNINIPDELRQILVDDYQQICNNNKLPILPAINTVDSLLRDYTNFKLEKQFDKLVYLIYISRFLIIFD